MDGKCLVPTTEPPVTVTEMPVTSITCNFDGGHFCSWRVEATKLKWQIRRYAYLQGDDVAPKEGIITSPVTMSTWSGKFCFSFWYYMDVEGENSLKVTAEHTVYWWMGAEFVSFWSREGNTGYRWRHVYVHVRSSKVNPRVTLCFGVFALY
ncbi:MAM and LDL-receptor class A domain-containing protein 1 [Caerostris extrusa]|uniref:MAM and LDL-receptor class A domain-containing protein 1 n=1 Tax=Caerostris extrusa TaxID=172846 RepID=A0AAV4TIQ4_CAEEX|nr:MAM and LDL-receptor class A domain-containing protein 1 [Caerostris extrusa]